MDFRILGPLEVLEQGRAIDVGGAKQRALLACLLLQANRVVSSDHLIEALWGERAPETAPKALQGYVSQLRKALGRGRIRTRTPGYQLQVEEYELDLERFRRLVSEGKLAAALALWRGTALADFAYEPFAQSDIARLEELRLVCLEQRIEADLEAGHHASLVGELEALVRKHSLRERLRAQLMLALYRSGRQAEALDVYRAGRTLLSEELGLEPGAELRELQRAILAQDPGLVLGEKPRLLERAEPAPEEPAPPPAAARSREVRKTVTVLVCDVISTDPELDPESLRHMTARGLEELLPVLGRHGAIVERSLDGAVTAVFGIPSVHEDDALRAARAATEMRERLAGLRGELEDHWGAWLELRAGIGTGEVVTGGGDDGQPFAIGVAVQSAHRLHETAERGVLLVDDHTHRLLRDAVDVEPVGEQARLLGVRPFAPGHGSRLVSPMVGRERERRRLHDAFEQAIVDLSCQLFTILGAPGVGKSRLVHEFVGDLSGRALVVRGRCLPYGEGITYWPVLEAVRDAAELGDADSAEENLARLAALLDGEEEPVLAAQRLGAVIGLTEELTAVEETFWAVCTFFEALARRQPLVVVFDDIHWGEATFLDLVDHVADWTRDAPVLVVCVARPELLDIRPQWGGGKLNATSVLLEPLSETESEQLVDNLAGAGGLEAPSRRQIVEAAGGNPLFVEEMLALLLEDGHAGSEIEVPPTIQALLAARLDRLAVDERAAIEAASVEGKVFHESSVAELVSSTGAAVHGNLQALVRKELIGPERPVFGGERAYRFRHLLIRDAAYESLPKEERATLHERHASWLEQRAGDRALEFEEILGYHLERVFRYRSELGPVDEEARELGLRAGRRLGLAGRRALARGDIPAAINLLSRAAALLPGEDPARLHLVPTVRAVQGLGAELGWAQEVLNEAMESDDPLLRAHARVQQALLDVFTRSRLDLDDLLEIASETMDEFERSDDDLGLARTWRLLQQARYLGREAAASSEAAERGLQFARRAGDWLEEIETITWLGIALFMGATPVPEAIGRLEALLPQARGGRAVEALLLSCLAALRAMEGEFSKARSLLDRARSVVDDLGYLSQLALVPFYVGQTELLGGDPSAAEEALRASLQPLEEIHETSHYCSIVATLARAVYDQGRYDEADELALISKRTARINDVHAQITWRSVRAKTLAQKGRYGEALALSQKAIDYAATGDFLNARGDAMLDRADILQLAGRPEEAASTLEEAIGLYEQKGNIVAAARTRSVLDALAAGV